jgi:hypothetical protein
VEDLEKIIMEKSVPLKNITKNTVKIWVREKEKYALTQMIWINFGIV